MLTTMVINEPHQKRWEVKNASNDLPLVIEATFDGVTSWGVMPVFAGQWEIDNVFRLYTTANDERYKMGKR